MQKFGNANNNSKRATGHTHKKELIKEKKKLQEKTRNLENVDL